MKNLIKVAMIGLFASSASLAASGRSEMQPLGLHCEYRKNPLGIDVAKPRLSWIIEANSDERGVRQSAYQILVASSEGLLKDNQGDLWDSGKVESDQQNQIEFKGKPLTSRARCFWKVKVWDQSGKPSEWSAPAAWSMGLLAPEDWQAQWIGNDDAYQAVVEAAADQKPFLLKGLKWVQMPKKEGKKSVDTYLRREVEIPADRVLKSATWVLYAFNECQATVNGVAVGSAVHWEATTRLDVTKKLKSGLNCLGLVVRHTDPHLPAAIGQLVLQFETGEPVLVALDASWKVAQQAASGWMNVGFNE
ncbi:MAG: hypothetical protein WCH43_17095, partial [Verrucomicrobiota bacterium]